MAGRTAKIDENMMRNHHVKMPGKVADVGVQRRPALGELGNRVRNPVVGDKKQALGDLKNNAPNLKEIKPRVDTHWKRDTNLVANKPLTRTDTIKLGGLAAGRLPTAVVIGQPKLVRTRTLQTAKPEVAQRVMRAASTDVPSAAAVVRPHHATSKVVAVAAEPQPRTVVQHVRRQESNLTRRSLTKLRAAIQKDKQAKAVTGGGNSASNSVGSSLESLEDHMAPVSHSSISIADVENIDANDDGTLILVSEYVNDIYSYMFALERALPIRPDYLADQREVTAKMRGVLVDWLNEVHMQFTLVQETFFMAVAIIDRYLQVVKTTSRQNLQLVGVTALFMASKYEELYPPEIRDFVYITDDTYDKKQILEMERHIFKKLEFNMGRPLPIHFLRRFAKAAHSGKFSDHVYLMSKYFIELAAVDHSMVHYLPSEVAGASLLLALRLMDDSGAGGKSAWSKTMEYYTTYTEEQLRPIVQTLAVLVKDSPNSKLRAVFNKYKQQKLGQISVMPELIASATLDEAIAGGVAA